MNGKQFIMKKMINFAETIVVCVERELSLIFWTKCVQT